MVSLRFSLRRAKHWRASRTKQPDLRGLPVFPGGLFRLIAFFFVSNDGRSWRILLLLVFVPLLRERNRAATRRWHRSSHTKERECDYEKSFLHTLAQPE